MTTPVHGEDPNPPRVTMSKVSHPIHAGIGGLQNVLKNDSCIMALTYCVQELSIISSIVPADIKSDWYNIINYKTVKERYGGPRIEKVLLPEAQGLQHITSVQKLQRDLCQLLEILRGIINEMRETTTCKILFNINNILKRMKIEEEQLIIECLNNIEQVRNLKGAFQMTIKTNRNRLNLLDKKMFELDNEVHDAELKVQITERFANHWENARYAQNVAQLQQQESTIEKETQDAIDKMENEKRIHNEIEKYLLLNMNNMNEEGDGWRRRFEEDTEKLYASTRDLDGKRAAQLSDYRQAKAEFEKRLQEMNDWVMERDERARQAEHEALLNRAATKIQAWWRGRMVYFFLGPFKKLKALMVKASAKKSAKAAKGGKGK